MVILCKVNCDGIERAIALYTERINARLSEGKTIRKLPQNRARYSRIASLPEGLKPPSKFPIKAFDKFHERAAALFFQPGCFPSSVEFSPYYRKISSPYWRLVVQHAAVCGDKVEEIVGQQLSVEVVQVFPGTVSKFTQI